MVGGGGAEGVNKQGGGGGGGWLHACKANAAPAPAASPASGSNLIGHGRWKVALSRSLFEKLGTQGAPLALEMQLVGNLSSIRLGHHALL